MPKTKTQKELATLFNNTTYGDSAVIIDSPLYDFFALASGTTEYRMFRNGLGSSTPAIADKQIWQTNAEGNGQLPSGHFRKITALKLFYTAAETRTAAEVELLNRVIRDMVFNFKISGLDNYGYFRAQEILGIPMAATVQEGTATELSRDLTTGRAMGILPLQIPIYIDELVTWSVDAEMGTDGGDGLAGDTFHLSLSSILLRRSS